MQQTQRKCETEYTTSDQIIRESACNENENTAWYTARILRAPTALHRIHSNTRVPGMGPSIPGRSNDEGWRPNTQRREQSADQINQGTASKRRLLSGNTSNARVMNDKEWRYTSRALNTENEPENYENCCNASENLRNNKSKISHKTYVQSSLTFRSMARY